MTATLISKNGTELRLCAAAQTTKTCDTEPKILKINKMNCLPIVLARYCVVPKDMPHTLPAWASGKHVKDVDIGPDYHYALRTLRAGYVYIFYDKNKIGANQWECYVVNKDGNLAKQPSAEAAQAPADMAQGSILDTQGIEIERPDLCGTAWLAYSEHKWSKDTLDRYTKDTQLRDKRMQTVKVPAMATTGNHSHGSPATIESLEAIIEYSPKLNRAKLPDGADNMQTLGKISNDDASGSYTESELLKQSTLYPWNLRIEAKKTVELLQIRAKRKDGGANIPSVLALWDAIGIAHELNGFRNEAAGRIEQYSKERDLELTAMNSIDGLKVALENQSGGKQKKFQDDMINNGSYAQAQAQILQRRTKAATLPDHLRRRELEVCDILEDWARRDVPRHMPFGLRLGQSSSLSEPRRSQDIAEIQKEVNDFLAKRDKNYQKNIAEAKTNAWPKYEKKLTPGAVEAFRKQYHQFVDRAQAAADARTVSLVNWLAAPLFLHTLEDCHPNNIGDGIEFEDKVGNAIFAMNGSPAGKQKIEEWVRDLSATNPHNLLWRTLALNQADTAIELNAALQEAAKQHAASTLSNALDIGNMVTKTLKSLADTHKKANSIFDANQAAGSAKGDQVFGQRIKAIKTGNIDKFAMTVGDSVYKRFRINGIADYASEKFIQHIFSVRGFVDPKDSLKLIIAQSANLEKANGQLLQWLKTGKTFLASDMPELKSAQVENLKAAWSEFKTDTEGKTTSGGLKAMKDARLAVVVGLIETLNFTKLMHDCETKNDVKSWGGLAASGLSITSALFDVASVPAKALFTKESWSYQKIKLFGGVLSMGATAVGVFLDVRDRNKAGEKGQDGLRRLYNAKIFLGTLNIVATGLTSISYAAPLVQRLTGRAVAGATMRAAGMRAAGLIAGRVLLLFAGGWVTLGVLAIQGLIWYFTPDALQDWLEESAFGPRKKKRSAAEQEAALGKALVEIGVISEQDLQNMQATQP